MSAPQEPVVIAEHGGLVVAERGPEILVIDRGNGPAQITAFVLLIITLVCGGFGAVTLINVTLFDATVGAAAHVHPLVGTVILAFGLAAGVAMIMLLNRIRTKRARPLSSLKAVAVVDRAHRIYRDGAGGVVAPLDQVRFERRMQMTSSSPKLVAVTPSGTYVLKRGNPFGGGIGDLDQVLNHAVHNWRR